MNRNIIAFIVAPLAVPLLFLPWLLSDHLALGWVLTAVIIAAVVSYAGMFMLGLPLYRLLRARGLTGIWVAATVGFVIGALMWLVFSVLFSLSLDQGFAGVRLALTNTHSLRLIFWPGGALGAVVGVLFWLIARPDKQPL